MARPGQIGSVVKVGRQSTEFCGDILVTGGEDDVDGGIAERSNGSANHDDGVNGSGSVRVAGIAGVDPDEGLVAIKSGEPIGQMGVATLPDNRSDVSDVCGSRKRDRWRECRR